MAYRLITSLLIIFSFTIVKAEVVIKTLEITESSKGGKIKLLLDRNSVYQAFVLKNPNRVVVDIPDALLNNQIVAGGKGDFVKNIRFGAPEAGTVRLAADIETSGSDFEITNNYLQTYPDSNDVTLVVEFEVFRSKYSFSEAPKLGKPYTPSIGTVQAEAPKAPENSLNKPSAQNNAFNAQISRAKQNQAKLANFLKPKPPAPASKAKSFEERAKEAFGTPAPSKASVKTPTREELLLMSVPAEKRALVKAELDRLRKMKAEGWEIKPLGQVFDPPMLYFKPSGYKRKLKSEEVLIAKYPEEPEVKEAIIKDIVKPTPSNPRGVLKSETFTKYPEEPKSAFDELKKPKIAKKPTAKTIAKPVTKPNVKAIARPAPEVIKKQVRPQIPRTKNSERVIVIDAGHGGVDPGAVSKTGSYEKNFTLDYAKNLSAKLKRAGYTVHLTRAKDKYVALRERVKFARDKDADLFISMHVDSAANTEARGVSVYTLSKARAEREKKKIEQGKDDKGQSKTIAGLDVSKLDTRLKNTIIDLVQDNTTSLSNTFANLVIKNVGNNTRLVREAKRTASLGVLTGADISSVLIEMGFLSNRVDEKLLKSASYKNKITNAILKSINEYFTQI